MGTRNRKGEQYALRRIRRVRRQPLPSAGMGKTGPLGFEPRNGGTKTRCLTAWRRPNETCREEIPQGCLRTSDPVLC